MNDFPYRRIAVAVDGSPAADAATQVAVALAAPGAELAFIHAVDRVTRAARYVPQYGSSRNASEVADEEERALFETARRKAARRGLRCSTHTIDGSISHAIAEYASNGNVDAVAIGTHSDHGIARAAIGSNAEMVVRTSGVPAIVTAAFADADATEIVFGRVLVAIDATQPSLNAIERALALALRHGADITFAHVAGRSPAQSDIALAVCDAAVLRAAREGLRANSILLHGQTAEALAESAQCLAADIIVTGTHARRGAARLRYGSVAEAVIRQATCPIMIVPGRPAASGSGYALTG